MYFKATALFLFLGLLKSLPHEFSSSWKIKFANFQIWGWNIAFLHRVLLDNYFFWLAQAFLNLYFIPQYPPESF